jgi:hypothetical protein
MPVITATWEVEIRGSRFKTSPGIKVIEPLLQRINWVWGNYVPIIPATREENCGLRPAMGKSLKLYLKSN